MTALSFRLAAVRRAVLASVVAVVFGLSGLVVGAADGGPASQRGPQQGRGAGQPGNPAEPQRTGGRPDALLAWEWWKDEAVKKELGLTDRQVAQITRIYEDRSRQAKPYSDEYVKQLEELDRMTRERTVDTPTYALQVSRVETLRMKLNETRYVMLYSFYRMLTPEQYQKLRDIRDRRRSGRGGD